MLCDVVRRRRRRRRRRWAHAPVIHAACHFDHKKRVAWVPISMHTCGSFFYNYGALRFAALRAAGAPLLCLKDHTQPVCFARLCNCYYPGIRRHTSHVDLSYTRA